MDLVSVAFFTLPTVTFRILFVFIVLRHDRRRIVHFNVTQHPSAEWTAQQMVDAFPGIRRRVTCCEIGIKSMERISTVAWRVSGSSRSVPHGAPRGKIHSSKESLVPIRRDCLDHWIVLDERHLRRILRENVDYYHSCRTHLSLEKDAPERRLVESPGMGRVSAIPKVRGLHHYYTRLAA